MNTSSTYTRGARSRESILNVKFPPRNISYAKQRMSKYVGTLVTNKAVYWFLCLLASTQAKVENKYKHDPL